MQEYTTYEAILARHALFGRWIHFHSNFFLPLLISAVGCSWFFSPLPRPLNGPWWVGLSCVWGRKIRSELASSASPSFSLLGTWTLDRWKKNAPISRHPSPPISSLFLQLLTIYQMHTKYWNCIGQQSYMASCSYQRLYYRGGRWADGRGRASPGGFGDGFGTRRRILAARHRGAGRHGAACWTWLLHAS